MILLVHMLFGALIGQKILNPFLAVILAFLSHYFLDLLPHIEYPIENIVNKQWKKAIPDIFRVVLDFCLGILLVLLFSTNQLIIYFCTFLAILPDGFSVISLIVKNKVLQKHNKFHQDKIHFLKQKKFSEAPISEPWRILTQVTVVIVFIILLIT